MREVGTFEAKTKLSTLVSTVAGGEEVVVARRGKAVACLVSADVGFDRALRTAAAALGVVLLGKDGDVRSSASVHFSVRLRKPPAPPMCQVFSIKRFIQSKGLHSA